ncbi:MAG: permease-like cell division protein FtsX [Steroidobacteraceae bacterium]
MSWLLRHVQALLFALGRLARAPVSTGFTVLVIALAITLPALFGLLFGSLRGATGQLAQSVGISVYFKRDVPIEKVRQLAESVQARRGVGSVTVIPADEAMESFRKDSGFGTALDALTDNPLPHAIDVRPADGSTSPAELEDLKRHLAAWPEVDLVQVDSEWVQRLDAIIDLARRLLLGTAALLAAGVVAVIGNTVRLELLNRRAEIEITKLVGGSNAFVRRPFLYTGLLYGALGALLALGLTITIRTLLEQPVRRLAASYGSDFALLMPTLSQCGTLVAAGGFLGLLGAWISASRHLSDVRPRR